MVDSCSTLVIRCFVVDCLEQLVLNVWCCPSYCLLAPLTWQEQSAGTPVNYYYYYSPDES